MNGNVKLLGMVATASIMLASCSNDELKEVYKGEKISFTTQVKTRATETTINNLNGFYVYADADNYEDMFINGRPAKKEAGKDNTFTIKDENGGDYLWPTGVKEVRFWAYGPDNLDTKTAFKPTITTHTQQFETLLESSMENGGTNQQDFIVAYQNVRQENVTGGAVKLDFYHALSQICINAKCPDHNNRKVNIKGAWLVNINQKGILSFSESATDTYHMQWTPSLPSNFGVKLENLPSLTSANTTLIGQAEGTTGDKSSSLMLIPQKQDKWTTDKPKGAYILFLCRIEAIHKGTVHSDKDSNGAIHVEGDYHYHQLFPTPQSDKWNRNEYGYTCVGIDIDWKPNHKYVYNVIFCGQGSGAGVYPPIELPDLPKIEGIEIVPNKDKDKVGETVLDSPLSFDVTVEAWEQGNTGNNDGNTNMD